MSEAAKLALRSGAVRLVAAGIGTAIAGPVGTLVGGLLGASVGDWFGEKAADVLGEYVKSGGEKISEFGVHFCYDQFQEMSRQPRLEPVVRAALRAALGEAGAALAPDARQRYNRWFENWDRHLNPNSTFQFESILDLKSVLSPGAGPEGVLANLDDLFPQMLERLDGEVRIADAANLSVVGEHRFRPIENELLDHLRTHLPAAVDHHFRHLMTEPENDRAWKTAEQDFQRSVLAYLSAIHSDTREAVKLEREYLPAIHANTRELLDRIGHRATEEASFPAISIGKLPTVNPLLVGRERWLTLLDQTWAEGEKNIVSIVAFGGVGKTSLAINWWHRNGAAGAKRILGWSFYSQGAKEDSHATGETFLDYALREWYGIAEPPKDSWTKGEKLAQLIQKEKTLLILDGLEPIQFPPGPQIGHFKDPGMVSLLRELDAHNPGLCVCTSRLPLSDLDNSATLEIDLDSLGDAGGEYLKLLGVRGPDDELQKASKEFGNHALALTLLGNLLNLLGADISQRDTIPSILEDPEKGGHARRVLRQYEHLFEGKPELEVLRMLGLFDRPMDSGAVKLLRKLPKMQWAQALANLKKARLIEYENLDGPLDCHPLVREHFAEEYRSAKPDEFRAAHEQLYEFYSKQAPELPDSVESMTPLFYSVYHGCQAGKHQEALNAVYFDRIRRGREFFLTQKLGAFGVNLSLLANFFVTPWSEPVLALSAADQSWVISLAAFSLRALGRLPDAVEPMKVGAATSLKGGDWHGAATDFGNLSELRLSLGDVGESISAARQSVEAADDSGDEFWRIAMRAALADALHQTGDSAEAARLFEEAEKMQMARHPEAGLLYSFPGYRWCDLLLAQGKSHEVLRRGGKTFEWRLESDSLLDIALDHLSLGRAHAPGSPEAAKHLDEAVSGLRRAGQLDHLPRGLLARAAHFRHTADFPAAQHDLDEVRTLATRCGMRLHLTDHHLEQARLLLAQHNPTAAQPHYQAAKQLIEETGYHRRDAELADLARQLA